VSHLTTWMRIGYQCMDIDTLQQLAVYEYSTFPFAGENKTEGKA
jgi:hypothetical protein